jgi:hypothetical protein
MAAQDMGAEALVAIGHARHQGVDTVGQHGLVDQEVGAAGEVDHFRNGCGVPGQDDAFVPGIEAEARSWA